MHMPTPPDSIWLSQTLRGQHPSLFAFSTDTNTFHCVAFRMRRATPALCKGRLVYWVAFPKSEASECFVFQKHDHQFGLNSDGFYEAVPYVMCKRTKNRYASEFDALMTEITEIEIAEDIVDNMNDVHEKAKAHIKALLSRYRESLNTTIYLE